MNWFEPVPDKVLFELIGRKRLKKYMKSKKKKQKKTKLGQALIGALKEELDSRKKAKIKWEISKYYPERDATEEDIKPKNKQHFSELP